MSCVSLGSTSSHSTGPAGSGVSKVPPILFKILNIQHHLLGISWEGRTYMDRASIPFGLHSSPKIFSDMRLHKAGIQHLTHYVDDFLFLVALHTDDGAQILSLSRLSWVSL